MAEDTAGANDAVTWDDIEFLFNEDSMTKTFGICKFDCMYEIETVATVNSNGQVKQNPTISAVKSGEEICVAIDCNFFIFSENYSDLKFSLRADSTIDSFAVSGDFILIGESNGQLKLIYIPLAQTVLAKTMFNSRFKHIAFSPRNNKGLYEAFVCSCESNVYKILNIDLDELSKALNDTDLVRARQMCDKISITDLSDEFTNGFLVKHCTIFTDFSQNTLFMLAGSGNALLKIENNYVQQVLDSDVFNGAFLLKAEFSNDGRYIIVIDSENIMHFLCAHTLLVLKSWFHMQVSDFMFWESSFNGAKNETEPDKLLIMTLPTDSYCDLQMYNFPSFELVYTTKLSEVSSFVRMPAQQENLFIMEGICNSKPLSEEHTITSVKIKCIMEMQPELKLSRLLKKRKFKEAEEFARLFNLDAELIYWTQLNCILEDMMRDAYSKLTEECRDDIESALFNCVTQLKNSTQLVECCRNFGWPTLGLFNKFLKAVKLKVMDNEKEIAVLNGLSYRLQTYELTFGEENFSHQWQLFASCDMLNEFVKHFREAREATALNLWLRHENEIIKDANIDDLLNVISLNLNMKYFFSNILPSILKCRPESLVALSDWMISYCKNMEVYQKEEWPSKALDFAKKALETLKSFSLKFEFLNINLNLIENHITNLSNFKDELEDLRVLWDNYKCCISYSNFTQQDKTTVCCQMLDDVFENSNLSGFISGYLTQFSKRFGLDINTVLLEYLKKMLSFMCPSSWEHIYINDRILIIFHKIYSDEHVCQAVLEVVSLAEIPWNETVEELVKKALLLDHSLISKIKEQIRFVDVKKKLIPYGLKNLNLNLKNKKSIMQVIQYIVVQDCATSLSDALEIAKLCDSSIDETEVYLFKLRRTVTNGSEDDFMSVLRILPQSSLLKCCHRFVNYVIVYINAKEDINLTENIHEEIWHLKAALTMLRYASVKFATTMNEKQQAELEIMITLKTEFGIHISFDQLESNLHSRDIFQQQIVILNNETNTTKLNTLFRLGRILKLKFEEICEILLLQMIEGKKGEMAIEVLKYFKLDFPYTNVSKFVPNICHLLKSVVQNDLPKSDIRSILFDIEELITFCLIHCKQIEEFKIYVMIKKWISLLVHLHSNETTFQAINWTDNEMYQELIFIMSDSDDYLTNFIFSLIAILLKMDENKENVYELEVSTLGKRMCSLLQSKGALTLSLELSSQLNECLSSNKFNKELTEMDYLKDAFDVQFTTSSLFKNVLNRKPLDKQFALGLGVCLPVETVYNLLDNVLRSFNFDYEHAEAVADLACLTFKFLNYPEEQRLFTSLHKQILWRRKISDLKIDSDCFGSSEIEDEIDWQSCIREFASNQQITFEFIIEFCNAFVGCLDDALFYYLECTLTSANIVGNTYTGYDYKDSGFFSKNISNFTNTSGESFMGEFAELSKTVEKAIDLIENKFTLINKLKSILKKISPYNYEKIFIVLCHLKILVEKDDSNAAETVKKKIDLLTFLFAYRRCQPPSESEATLTDKYEHDKVHERLPFHFFISGNPWNVLTTELNLDTVNIWICAVPLLQLSSSNEILAVAVRNEVTRTLQKIQKHTDKLQLRVFPELKLEKVFKVIKEISDATLAVSCANWVTDALPLGPEKVYSAKCTVDLAKYWANVSSEKMQLVTTRHSSGNVFEENYKKLQSVYERISTEVILLNYNLRNDETLRLIRTPVKLLIYLYQKKNDKLQIYNAAEEISQIFEISHEDIEMKLIDKWLAETSVPSDSEPVNVLENAIYLLRHLPKEQSVLYLLNKVVQEESCRNYAYRYRALKCLAAIANPIEIQSYSKNFITDVRQFLLAFHYLSQVERLNFHLTLTSFLNCNKEKLGSAIWSKLNHNSKDVNLISNFCLDYNIKNVKLLESILDEMVSQKMVNAIEKFMLLNSPMTELWQSNSYIAAWQFILIWPFQNGTVSNIKEKINDYVQMTENLFRSPVCTHVFLEKLCTEFIAIGLPAIGVGCLFHVTEIDDRLKLLKLHANENTLKNIRDNLIWFHNEAITFPQLTSVVSFFVNCSQKCLYKLTIDTPYYNLLIKNLINQNSIEGLLVYLRHTQRWDDCQQLIEQYCKQYSNPEFDDLLQHFKNEELVTKMLSMLESK